MTRAFYILGLSFLMFYINTNTHVDYFGNNQAQKIVTFTAAWAFLAGSIFCAIIALN